MSQGRQRTGSRELQGFESHRCGMVPDGVSIRRYDRASDEYVYRGLRGWMLHFLSFDAEYGWPYMEAVGEIAYCPWCGERLD